jgi:hypothetical protein
MRRLHAPSLPFNPANPHDTPNPSVIEIDSDDDSLEDASSADDELNTVLVQDENSRSSALGSTWTVSHHALAEDSQGISSAPTRGRQKGRAGWATTVHASLEDSQSTSSAPTRGRREEWARATVCASVKNLQSTTSALPQRRQRQETQTAAEIEDIAREARLQTTRLEIRRLQREAEQKRLEKKKVMLQKQIREDEDWLDQNDPFYLKD